MIARKEWRVKYYRSVVTIRMDWLGQEIDGARVVLLLRVKWKQTTELRKSGNVPFVSRFMWVKQA